MNDICKDSAGLNPFENDQFVIGFVDEVNGRGAEEIRGFLPTRHELIQLARYWANAAIDIEYFWFCYQGSSSSEIRRRPFAWRRVSRIAELLGENEVKQAVNEAYEDFGAVQNPRIWNIFRNGTPEEKEALQGEFEDVVNGDLK